MRTKDTVSCPHQPEVERTLELSPSALVQCTCLLAQFCVSALQHGDPVSLWFLCCGAGREEHLILETTLEPEQRRSRKQETQSLVGSLSFTHYEREVLEISAALGMVTHA